MAPLAVKVAVLPLLIIADEELIPTRGTGFTDTVELIVDEQPFNPVTVTV